MMAPNAASLTGGAGRTGAFTQAVRSGSKSLVKMGASLRARMAAQRTAVHGCGSALVLKCLCFLFTEKAGVWGNAIVTAIACGIMALVSA